MEERKDPAMRNQRTFSLEFKRQVVEELLSGESRPAQLCRITLRRTLIDTPTIDVWIPLHLALFRPFLTLFRH